MYASLPRGGYSNAGYPFSVHGIRIAQGVPPAPQSPERRMRPSRHCARSPQGGLRRSGLRKNLPAPAENGTRAGSDASEIRPFRRNFPPAAILPPRAWLRCIRIVTRRFLRMLHGQGSMLFSSSRISRLKTTLDAAGKLRRHRADDVEPGSRSAQLRKLQNGTPPFRHDFC